MILNRPRMQLSIVFAGALFAALLGGCANRPEGTVDDTAGAKARAEIVQRMGSPTGPNAVRPGTAPGGTTAPNTTAPTGAPAGVPGVPAGVPIGPPR